MPTNTNMLKLQYRTLSKLISSLNPNLYPIHNLKTINKTILRHNWKECQDQYHKDKDKDKDKDTQLVLKGKILEAFQHHVTQVLQTDKTN